jgi:hypothetical protein
MKLVRNTSVVAVALASTIAYAGASNLLVSGQVESVDAATGMLTVQGHSFKSADARRVLPGQMVNVYGTINADGTIANAVLESAPSYAVQTSSTSTSKAAALTGTGAEAQALTGTGGKAEALTGTGSHTEALTGTGSHTEALTGTGSHTEALTGTGGRAEALTGTGDRTEALTGTGNRSEALTGTGNRAEALTGTGNHVEALTGTGGPTG